MGNTRFLVPVASKVQTLLPIDFKFDSSDYWLRWWYESTATGRPGKGVKYHVLYSVIFKFL